MRTSKKRELVILKENYKNLQESEKVNSGYVDRLTDKISCLYRDKFNDIFINHCIIKEGICYIITNVGNVTFSLNSMDVCCVKLHTIQLDSYNAYVLDSDVTITVTYKELLNSRKISTIDDDRITSVLQNISKLKDLELWNDSSKS